MAVTHAQVCACGLAIQPWPGRGRRRTWCLNCSPRRTIPAPVYTWTCAGCGAECSRPATKGQRPKWCGLCRQAQHRDWLPVEVRREVYERDEWTCQVCADPVDRDLIGSRSDWRPSLDHINPRSKGGSDDPSNLRLAHLWCNAALNDGRSYTDDDFRRILA